MHSDILRNNVKDKLARGEVVASMTVRLVRAHRDRPHRQDRGLRHALRRPRAFALTMDATGQICMACLDVGIMPAVRVPANTPDYISRVLDAGALGVIAPHVRSAAEARAVVQGGEIAAARRALERRRLPHLHYRSFPAAETCAALNDATMVIVQFESGGCARQGRGDRRGRGHRHGAGRPQRHAGATGARRPVRSSARARGLSRPHRRLPQARQALRRRRARQPPRPDGRVSSGWARAMCRPAPTSRFCSAPAPHGRSRSRTSSSDVRAAAIRARRVYASAVAADAFARSLLHRHGVPPEDAATIAAAWSAPICAASTPTASAASRSISIACAAA